MSTAVGLTPEAIVRLELDSLVLLDQTLLPGQIVERRYTRWQDVIVAIRSMVVRGAPAIGVTAAYAVALAAISDDTDSLDDLRAHIDRACAGLASARPTAVNLGWAIERMRAIAAEPYADRHSALRVPWCQPPPTCTVRRSIAASGIGDAWRRAAAAPARSVLTHCNAGALATAGYGTALGVIRAAHERGQADRASAPTRPGRSSRARA